MDTFNLTTQIGTTLRAAITAAMLLCMAGCGTWTQPGADKYSARKDKRECSREAGYAPGLILGFAASVYIRECMKEKGYEWKSN